jgi:hypothetical protein
MRDRPLEAQIPAMATFGIEAIRTFAHHRESGLLGAHGLQDLTYTFDRSDGLKSGLEGAGHVNVFYWRNTNVFETDLRDVSVGLAGHQGFDDQGADAVQLFWIETHGGHDAGASPKLAYDIAAESWEGSGSTWKLGDGAAEILMIFGCDTVGLENVIILQNIFNGLHMYCGAWDLMWDAWTTDECGEDVADNLTDGDTVSDAWIDGVSDWYYDLHPITVCVDEASVWNDGDVRWSQSRLNREHLEGHGEVRPDLLPPDQACMLWRWAEG